MKILPATIPITEPGFYELTAAQYHADPCELSLSRGVADLLLEKSPLHAQYAHPKLNLGPREDNSTPEMKLGSTVHGMVLGGGPPIAVAHGCDSWRTKLSQEFRDNALVQGHIPMLPAAFEQAQAVAAVLDRQIDSLEFGQAFRCADHELTAVWQEGPCWLRARFDGLFVDEAQGGAIAFDLKTTNDASPGALQRRTVSYNLQAAYYTAGVEKLLPHLAGRVRFLFLYIETSPPYGVALVELDEAGATLGRYGYERAVGMWQQCVAEGSWPGYSQNVVTIQTPPWALQTMYQEVVV